MILYQGMSELYTLMSQYLDGSNVEGIREYLSYQTQAAGCPFSEFSFDPGSKLRMILVLESPSTESKFQGHEAIP